MKKIITLLLLSIVTTVSAQQIKLTDRITIKLYSDSENFDRTVYIQLPTNYGKVNKCYPLIILFDAQDQSLLNYTSSAIDRLIWSNDIPEAIFVGIVQNDRSKELNFEKNERSASHFLNFIKNDLISYLHKNYSLNGYYTLIGHSLGGQFVTQALLSYPEIFRSAISISGALNYPNNEHTIKSDILSKAENAMDNISDRVFEKQKYYFSTGDMGFQDQGFKWGALKLDSIYKTKKGNSNNWRFDPIKGFNHMTTPLISVPAGLIFIFQDWHFSDSLAMNVLQKHQANPLKVLKEKNEKVLKSYGVEITLPYHAVYQFADYCLTNGKVDEAEILAKKLIEYYPNDSDSYGLMGEICIKKGDVTSAIKLFENAHIKSSDNRYLEKIKKLRTTLKP